VDNLSKTGFLDRPDMHEGLEGEFKGWRTWSNDNFETHSEPFWHRMDDSGAIRCAFRVENKTSMARATSMAAPSWRSPTTACLR
jgi:hypothetical protein